jgi:Glyoxalase-like domain
MASQIDHLVLAGTDLAALVADVTEQIGSAPVPGGPHPGRGTRNALVGLGSSRYLELIGPDPDQPPPAGPRQFGIDAITEPTLVAWCARPTRPLADAVAEASAAGFDLGPLASMSRQRPDGVLLQWQLTFPQLATPDEGTVPFLIDWGDSPHPSTTLPAGVELLDLTLGSPDPDRLRTVLAIAGEFPEVTVVPADRPTLHALLQTPNGEVHLRG